MKIIQLVIAAFLISFLVACDRSSGNVPALVEPTSDISLIVEQTKAPVERTATATRRPTNKPPILSDEISDVSATPTSTPTLGPPPPTLVPEPISTSGPWLLLSGGTTYTGAMPVIDPVIINFDGTGWEYLNIPHPPDIEPNERHWWYGDFPPNIPYIAIRGVTIPMRADGSIGEDGETDAAHLIQVAPCPAGDQSHRSESLVGGTHDLAECGRRCRIIYILENNNRRARQFRKPFYLDLYIVVHVRARRRRCGRSKSGCGGVSYDRSHFWKTCPNSAVHEACIAWADVEKLDNVADGGGVKAAQAVKGFGCDGHDKLLSGFLESA